MFVLRLVLPRFSYPTTTRPSARLFLTLPNRSPSLLSISLSLSPLFISIFLSYSLVFSSLNSIRLFYLPGILARAQCCSTFGETTVSTRLTAQTDVHGHSNDISSGRAQEGVCRGGKVDVDKRARADVIVVAPAAAAGARKRNTRRRKTRARFKR